MDGINNNCIPTVFVGGSDDFDEEPPRAVQRKKRGPYQKRGFSQKSADEIGDPITCFGVSIRRLGELYFTYDRKIADIAQAVLKEYPVLQTSAKSYGHCRYFIQRCLDNGDKNFLEGVSRMQAQQYYGVPLKYNGVPLDYIAQLYVKYRGCVKDVVEAISFQYNWIYLDIHYDIIFDLIHRLQMENRSTSNSKVFLNAMEAAERIEAKNQKEICRGK